MTRPALSTVGLTRSFGGILALNKLDLEVPRGAVTGFLGPNGAGKTTTIRLLLGLIRPDAGQVRIFGRSLERHRRTLLARIGALVEMPSLYLHLTGRENLKAACWIGGGASTDVARCLALTGLEHAADRAVRGYSLGMKQRLGLALALLRRPELLILDEPTNGLDPAGIQESLALLRRLADEEGVTVFLSSHRLSEVEQVASHLIILRRGQAVFQGTVAALARAGRGQVRVGVDRGPTALAWLREQGLEVSMTEDNMLLVTAQAPQKICRQLIEAGFDVHHLSIPAPALEARFLDLMDAPEETETTKGEAQ